jgi:hypothetical protein
MSFLAAPVFHTLSPRTAALHTAMRTRIACYFDVPRADSRADFANYVDVRTTSPSSHRTLFPHFRAFFSLLVVISRWVERRRDAQERPRRPLRRVRTCTHANISAWCDYRRPRLPTGREKPRRRARHRENPKRLIPPARLLCFSRRSALASSPTLSHSPPLHFPQSLLTTTHDYDMQPRRRTHAETKTYAHTHVRAD